MSEPYVAFNIANFILGAFDLLLIYECVRTLRKIIYDWPKSPNLDNIVPIPPVDPIEPPLDPVYPYCPPAPAACPPGTDPMWDGNVWNLIFADTGSQDDPVWGYLGPFASEGGQWWLNVKYWIDVNNCQMSDFTDCINVERWVGIWRPNNSDCGGGSTIDIPGIDAYCAGRIKSIELFSELPLDPIHMGPS